jgi:hypothetical protein
VAELCHSLPPGRPSPSASTLSGAKPGRMSRSRRREFWHRRESCSVPFPAADSAEGIRRASAPLQFRRGREPRATPLNGRRGDSPAPSSPNEPDGARPQGVETVTPPSAPLSGSSCCSSREEIDAAEAGICSVNVSPVTEQPRSCPYSWIGS